MKKILVDLGFWLLLVVLVFVSVSVAESVDSNTASDVNDSHGILLGKESDPLYTWMNSRSAIKDTLIAGLAMGAKVEDGNVSYDKIATECIATSRRVKSYESRFFSEGFYI